MLGICVGMQVLFERGVEHGVETEGCDEWPGVVERLQAPIVPHMGWNTVDVPGRLAAVRRASRTSGSTSCTPTASATGRCETDGRTRAPLVTWAEHGGDRFVAAVENGPLWATQFHPEKSGDAGAAAAAQLGRHPVSDDGKERAPSRAPSRRAARQRTATRRPERGSGEAERQARGARRPASGGGRARCPSRRRASAPAGCRSARPAAGLLAEQRRRLVDSPCWSLNLLVFAFVRDFSVTGFTARR